MQSENVEGIDPATTVITKMREQGISSLPRNYELVYQFLNTSNAALIREFAALGRRPTQEQLDSIGKKFLPHHHGINTVDQTRARISDEMQAVIRLVMQDRSTLKKYSHLLGETSSRLSESNATQPDAMADLVRIISSATGDTIEKSGAAVHQMIERAEEMAQLKSELEEYKRLATVDAITRLSNRRAFDERLSAIYDNKQDAMHQALILGDIDHFKTFNDTYGHQVGDRVLSVAAAMMQKSVSKDVFLARTGGEEFAIILHGISLQDATETAERVRLAVEATPLKNQNDGVDCGRITMSFGVCMATDAANAQELYRKADVALYEAKDAGRNQVRTHIPKMLNWPFFKR